MHLCQIYGRLFQIAEQGVCPFLPEIVLDCLDRLVVVVADGLELVVEIGKADIVVHRRLVDSDHLDFLSENHCLDEFGAFPQSRFLKLDIELYVLFRV